MSKKRNVIGAALSMGVLASNATVFASHASADSWSGRHDRRYGIARPYHHIPQGYQRSQADRTGERIAKGIIIGVGAAIVGAILSDAARAERRRHHFDD